MSIVVKQAALVLGHLAQILAELLRFLVRWIEVGLKLDTRAEALKLMVQIVSDRFQCLIRRKTVRVDSAFKDGTGIGLHDIRRVHVDV